MGGKFSLRDIFRSKDISYMLTPEEAASRKDVAMKALGLVSLLFGFAALPGAWSEAQAAAPPASHTFVRPPIVAPHGNPRPGIGWGCNRRRFASGSYFAPSWLDYSAYPQQDAPPPEPTPSPVVNYVFVNAPASAPPPERLGPRFIAVDPHAFARPQNSAPLVIYGDAPD
jgi:hypothetical protein